MRQGPFTPDGSAATTVVTNATCEVGWDGVAPVAKPVHGRVCGVGLKRLRFIAQQHAGDDVPGPIVARSIAQRSYPVLPIPGNDASFACQPSTMLHHACGTKVLPHHFVLTGELQADRSSHCLREYGRIEGDSIGTIQSIAA